MPRSYDAFGARVVETYSLATQTVIHDGKHNRQVMLLDGVVVLPIGAEVELVDPNVNARVVGVRLLARTAQTPAAVCLDIEVTGEWYGDDEGTPAADRD